MTNITKFILVAALIGTLSATASANGTSAAQFLKLGAGARAAGMGDAFSSVSDDVTAGYWNPAGLSQLKNSEIGFMHNSALLNGQYQYIGAAKPFGENTMAVSAYRMSYGSIEGYDVNDVKTGTFDASDTSIALSYSRKLSQSFFIGLTGKYISETIQTESASTFAGDFGIFSKERLFNRFNFGISLQNVGGGLTFVKKSESLPQTIRGGISTAFLDGKMLTAVDVVKANDSGVAVNLGAEFKANSLLSLRGGYKAASGQEFSVNGLANVTAGIGLQLNQFNLDYAFSPFGDLGAMHRVSLVFHFAEK